jgi:formylmethanofuran dehydrogenase subunit E
MEISSQTAASDNQLAPNRALLKTLLRKSASRHQHLCPRQVLGVRLALKGLQELNLIDRDYRPQFQNPDKRLLTVVETDGCGADGVAVATDCSVGRRTLRVFDFGKLAATLVDTESGLAVRVSPMQAARSLAEERAPQAPSRWHAYLEAYQHIPDEELIRVQTVRLTQSIASILSRPDARSVCGRCGEEIFNEREVRVETLTLCRSCAGDTYYAIMADTTG